MLGLYREVSGDDSYDEMFHRFCAAFHENYMKSPTASLDSYPGLCWSSEQAPPLRALKVHDDIFGTDYGEAIRRWQAVMEEKFVDPGSGLLVTMYDRDSGRVFEGPRTITNTWTILFLHDVLPEFCRGLYGNVKKEFMVRRLGFPVFKEYLGEEQEMTGDTGPIIWGAALPSTCFAMGCAGVYGDMEVFLPASALADAFGGALTLPGTRRYLVVGEIGTAAAFFCRSMLLLADEQHGFAPVKNIVFMCLFLAAASGLVVWRIRRLAGLLRKARRGPAVVRPGMKV